MFLAAGTYVLLSLSISYHLVSSILSGIYLSHSNIAMLIICNNNIDLVDYNDDDGGCGDDSDGLSRQKRLNLKVKGKR